MKSKKSKSTKSAPKKIKTLSQDTFTASQVGVLIEEQRGQFNLFIEKQRSLEDKIDSSMGMIAKNAEGITFLKLQTCGIKDDITKINGKIAKIEDDVKIIKSDIVKIDTRLTNVKHQLTEVKKDTEEIKYTIKPHEERLTRLEVGK